VIQSVENLAGDSNAGGMAFCQSESPRQDHSERQSLFPRPSVS